MDNISHIVLSVCTAAGALFEVTCLIAPLDPASNVH